MRVIRGLVFLLLSTIPCTASAQSFVVQGSAGPTLIDSGYSLAAGIGLSPTSHLTLLFDVEGTHLSSRLRSDGRGGVAGFRGGNTDARLRAAARDAVQARPSRAVWFGMDLPPVCRGRT